MLFKNYINIFVLDLVSYVQWSVYLVYLWSYSITIKISLLSTALLEFENICDGKLEFSNIEFIWLCIAYKAQMSLYFHLWTTLQFMWI